MSVQDLETIPAKALETTLALAREVAQRKTREAIAASQLVEGFEREMLRRKLPANASLDVLLAELDKLPREPFSPGVFFNEEGDMLEVFWKNTSRIAEWKNHLITLYWEACEDGSTGGVVGVSIHGVLALLATPGTWITPDPANPTPKVQAARKEGVCRLCGEKPGDGPGMPFVFNCGEEYAHQACLEAQRKGDIRERVLRLLPRTPEWGALRQEPFLTFLVQLAEQFEAEGGFRESRRLADEAAPRA